MKRYEVRFDNDDGKYINDTVTNKPVYLEQVCDLLNSHAGMKTREEVEKDFARAKNIWDTSQFCSLQIKGEMMALQAVLDRSE